MIEESLFKSNYLGKDGFIWWIGQVAPPEYWKTEETSLKDGWAFRCKVRIVGYHTFDGDVLPDPDLPFAHVMIDPAFGSAQGSLGRTLNIVGGETVFGFFLDGEDAQQPVIIGLLYRSEATKNLIDRETVLKDKSSKFKPFTGNYGPMDLAPTQIAPNPKETLETPKNDSEAQVLGSAKNEQTPPNKTADERVLSKDKLNFCDSALQASMRTISEVKIISENGCDNSFIGKLTKELRNFISVINGLKKTVNGFIDPILGVVTDTIRIAKKFARSIMSIMKGIINLIRSKVITTITNLFRDLVGFVIPPPQQTVVAESSKNILDIIFCIFEKVIDFLEDYILDMLLGMVGRAINIPLCAAEEFMSALLGKMADAIDSALNPILSGIDWLMQGIGKVFSILDKATSIATQILGFIGCDSLKCKAPSEWAIKFGASQQKIDNWNKVTSKLNVLRGAEKELDKALNKLSVYGGNYSSFSACSNIISNPTQRNLSPPPYGTKYDFCLPPIVKIFGGGGMAAQAEAIVSDDGTGRILGIELLDGGFGYTEIPSIRIIDNTNHGSGATAGASIKDGKITGIYITKPGSGYCRGNYFNFTLNPYYIVTSDDYSPIVNKTFTLTITGYNVGSVENLTYSVNGNIKQSQISIPLKGSIKVINGKAYLPIKTLDDPEKEDDNLDKVVELIFDFFDSKEENVARTYIYISNNEYKIDIITTTNTQSPPGIDVPSKNIGNGVDVMLEVQIPINEPMTTGSDTGVDTGVDTGGILRKEPPIVVQDEGGIPTSYIFDTTEPPIDDTGTKYDIVPFDGNLITPTTGQNDMEVPTMVGDQTQAITTITTGQNINQTGGLGGENQIGGGIMTDGELRQIPPYDQQLQTIPPSANPIVILDYFVPISGGFNYSDGDKVIIDDTIYEAIVDNGIIVGSRYVSGKNEFSSPPSVSINSLTGEGAALFPVYKLKRTYEKQPLVINVNGILEVINCV